MRRALMWLNLYGREAVWHKLKNRQKQAKNAFFVFFGCFWAYVGQPHDHIGWATSMPFASINPTNPRTNPWNFWKKILRIGGAGKLTFCLVFSFFVFGYWVFQKKIFFVFLSMKRLKAFIWGSFFFCTMDGFFRILEKLRNDSYC